MDDAKFISATSLFYNFFNLPATIWSSAGDYDDHDLTGFGCGVICGLMGSNVRYTHQE